MRPTLILLVPVVLLAICAVGLADPVEVTIDGYPSLADLTNLPPSIQQGDGGRTIDIVGDTSNSSTLAGRAKGNAYRVDVSVTLDEAEFWLNFTSTQTLTYYVFVSPVEFGTYTEVYRNSEVVSGSGAGWYSSGAVSVLLSAGSYYIIVVSWDGTMTYFYGTGDTQATSFGAYVHGYATGYDPLPSSFDSLSNDQAIYHQRLTTTTASAVEESTWGRVKAFYR